MFDLRTTNFTEINVDREGDGGDNDVLICPSVCPPVCVS